MTEVFTSDIKGKHFLSAAALVLTIVIIKALDFLREYVSEKFPQYLPESKVTLPERVIIALMIIFAAVYVVFILILLPMWYRTIRYTVTDREIISDTGLISKTHRIMKLSAVQNAALVSMPFSKYTGFNFISVNALGGRLILMFLSDKDSIKVMKLIDGKNAAARPEKEDIISAYEKRARNSRGANQPSPVFDVPNSNDYDNRQPAVSYTSFDDVYGGPDSPYVQLSFPEDILPEDDRGEQLSFSDFSSEDKNGK
ncbi:MAG: PH domain-containing protein [Huintestinicola sp.]